VTPRAQSNISPLLVVRFAAVDADFGSTGIPRGRPRTRGAHRKQPTQNRVGSTGFFQGITAPELNRRRFLGTLAAATVAGVGAARLVVDPQPRTFAQTASGGAVTSGPTAPAGDLLALTLDDGVNSEVVRAYTQLAKDTGIRLTYFVNGIYNSWTENKALLRPLVESGQIQLGNHTWSHPDLTTLTKTKIAEQLTRNDDFLKKTYGVGAKPYFRPPYAKHDGAVDAVAADLGYTVPTLWSGSLSDSTLITEDYIVQMADKYFTPQDIVIGHLNHAPVTHVYGQLVDIIRSRNLRTVTLNDVFLKTP
jgi:peptidoglycan/xylan/chitin deacetylase (PgdA/CDA1 family)